MIKGLPKCACYIGKLSTSVEHGLKMLKFALLFLLLDMWTIVYVFISADINECDNSPCSQICTNTEGSYSCSCNDGFLLSNTSECTDYDECLAPVSPCDQQCTNTIGSYKCSCNDGFILNITTRTTCYGTYNSC